MARRVALRMVRSEQLAEDLAQEAIVAAYLSLGSLRDEGRFASWLYGIVLNVCRNHIRAQKTDSLVLGGFGRRRAVRSTSPAFSGAVGRRDR